MFYLPSHLINRSVTVALIGAGGTGSFLAAELVTLKHVMEIFSPESSLNVTVFDGGVVTEANCIRQNFYKSQIGMNKAAATAWTTNNLHGCNFQAIERNATADELSNFDLIITCVDIPSIRYQIHQKTKNKYRNIIWLDTGNNDTAGQIILGELANGTNSEKLLPTVCDLYDFSEQSDEQGNKKSCSAMESLSKQNLGVNATSARHAAQLLTNLFTKGYIEYHGTYFNTEDLSSNPIKIDPEVWAVHGYKPTAKAK
ncbi:PRTRC system ThiF family protein [Vibrio sp. Y2-5]|uniref:PRTRC system ThiF family protein n=1 Tax=Vibrio sp. Y2-5 TaxID=2743977 RepID=UPI001660CFA8|nr:PRTRC system ThiF family protein [Vibrio sp. Y2-5]MBD0788228.1 PRTRC system ThiF family protein [Vibrio sp. Y2-5]